MEDTAASQDAKTLVPMSLSLVAKKEKILQMEVAKLEKLLAQRNEMLGGLRESHEYLLTTNGQLQEPFATRDAGVAADAAGADQEQNGKDKPGLCDTIGVNELEATAEKCGVLKDILLGLGDKRAGLEQQYMGCEEQTARNTMALRAKEERLREGIRNTHFLLQEDIHSTQWNFTSDQAELAAEDKHLNAVSQNAQGQAAAVEKADTALRAEKAAVEDLRTTWHNYEDMVHEEHRQLAIANEDARSEQRELQKLLQSTGATCAADEDVLQAAKDLQVRLQHLNAKHEQLTWLDRQRVHLENEQKEAVNAHAADEAAYCTFIEEHNAEMASLEAQIKYAGKQMKSTERAITARNKKMAAVKTENGVRRAAFIMRDVSEIQHTHKTLAMMRNSIAATQTAVKNRIDEIRDKFLSTFVMEDAENLIQLLNKEIESWTTKDMGEVDDTIARETLMLKERYNILTAETRKKFGKTLRQKPQARIGKNTENPVGEENEANIRELDPSRMSNEGKLSKVCLVMNEVAVLLEAHSFYASADSTFQRALAYERSAETSSKVCSTWAQLVDESLQTDNDLTDTFTADTTAAAKVAKPAHSTFSQQRSLNNASGVRPRRLRRRRPAQKAGKPAAASITPELALSVDNDGAAPAHRNPATEMSSQDPLDSPVGCDEDLAVPRPAQDAKKTSSIASQGAAKKPLVQKVGQRSKGATKRRTRRRRSLEVKLSINDVFFGPTLRIASALSSAASMTAMVSALGLASFSSSARQRRGAEGGAEPQGIPFLQVTKLSMAKASVDGKNVVRPYTPTNTNAEKGELELVVKGYPTGKLSKHIVSLNVGDELAMKGPFVKFEYKPNQYKSVGFLCGGSGITPALQVVKEICRNPDDSTQVVLIFCNQTEKDIILRDELDALQYMYPQFQVHYVLDKAEANWEGYTGYVTKELVEKLLPGPSDESLIGVCGHPR
ncbi:Riboflavin synthase-like beta-barrel [Phytophthora cactorum]|nr:Riboflavin synthase-like beta-barrel [Phytophthora cactorum]